MEITLNPGFVLILGAFGVLAAPGPSRDPNRAVSGLGLPFSLRTLVFFLSAAAAMWALLANNFGAGPQLHQIGLDVVLRNIDPLNQVFGIAFIAGVMLLCVFTSARRNRVEDAAILMLAGGVVSALFLGDFVSFVAAASLAGLAATWVVMASPQEGAGAAGVRLLIWHGLEGLLILAGVAFHISARGPVFTQLSVHTPGDAFIFAALMIRVGAPLAHVWLKDVISRASPSGGVALTLFSTLFGVYALARFFPAEPVLIPIGAAMIVIGALYGAAEDDFRRATAYALTAQTGLCVVLVGLGSPLAQAGAASHAFTALFAFALLEMALGAILLRTGSTRLSELEGLGRQMPLTSFLLVLGGAAAAGMPGLALYTSLAIAFQTTAHWETRYLWLLFAGLSGVLFCVLVARPALTLFGRAKRPATHEAPFPMLLGMALAAFFCIAFGVAPDFLYGLAPPEGLEFAPHTPARMGPQLELLGAAGAIYVLLRAMKLAPKEKPATLLDLDAFYGGPVAGAERWIGVVALRVFGALQGAWSRLSARASAGFRAGARACDRPYRDRWAGAAQLAAICTVLVLILLARL